MSATGRRRIEDVVDEALQSLLDGETAETILARYPAYEVELTSLLFAANSLKDAPQPQLSQASIAAIVIASRTAHAGSIPQPVKQTWQERVAAWMRPAASLLKVPTALAALAVVIIALVTMARLLDKPQIYPPVPTITAQFTIDGKIEQVAAGMWTVDGGIVYLDSHTIITGTPMIGSQAHIEGDIASDNRRMARTIIVSQAVSITTTATPGIESGASATPQSTRLTLTEDATTIPTAIPMLPPIPALPVTSTVIPTASKAAGVGTRPSPTTIAVPATSGTKPSPITPTQTRTVKALPTPSNIVPTVTAWIATPQPTTTRQPSPMPTSTVIVQPSSTARPAEPTRTAVPQPEPTETREVEPSHTPEPEQTQAPEPTNEPENTPHPHATSTSEPENTPQPHATSTSHTNPTSTVEPQATSTTQPTTTTVPVNTPTTQPTIPPTAPPVGSPTRTEEPQETETAEPTHGPESTHTGQSTRTAEPTRTEDIGTQSTQTLTK